MKGMERDAFCLAQVFEDFNSSNCSSVCKYAFGKHSCTAECCSENALKQRYLKEVDP